MMEEMPSCVAKLEWMVAEACESGVQGSPKRCGILEGA